MSAESKDSFDGPKDDLENRIKSVYDDIETPANLWPRIRRSHELRSLSSSQPKYSFMNFRFVSALALAVFVLAIGTMSYVRIPFSTEFRAADNTEQALPDILTSEFSTFVASGRNLDVSGSDVSVLINWFSSRLQNPQPPEPPVASTLRLTGGRLCEIQGKRIASYMYEINENQIALYITSENKPSEAIDSGNSIPKVSTQNKIAFATWQQLGWRYSLVASISSQKLSEIAKIFSKDLREKRT